MHRRVAALAALALILTTGCATEAADPPASAAGTTPVVGGPPWHDEIKPAAAGSTVGAGGGCDLPVTFSVPEEMKAKRIEVPDEGEFADALKASIRRGGATTGCEIGGLEVGSGFFQVWTVDKPGVESRPALEAFVAAGHQPGETMNGVSLPGVTVADAQYRDVRAGAFDAVEATWTITNTLVDDQARRGWALAVRAGDRTVLLSVNTSLITEPGDVLPGYRLATGTLAAAG
ncbi:lipoprotein [Micromonospora fluostatini]|uniref:lipoprotein n=1 Tax=Micromonospora sp. JCM 30529 TaxID=3421643 RepID=UPI003D16E9B3